MKWLFFAVLLVPSWSRAETTGPESDSESFRGQVDVLNQRYQDFFTHGEEAKRYYDGLRQGIPARKDERRLSQEAADQARHNFKREPPADSSALEAEHDKQVEAQEHEFDGFRRQYVERRRELNQIRNSARKIPENADAGLQDSVTDWP